MRPAPRPAEAEIISKAAELFSSKGYHATSMLDIADAVGLNKATLYHYFPSKEAILLRITGDIRPALTPAIEAIVNSAQPARDKLRHIITHHVEFIGKHIGPMRVLLLDYRHLSQEANATLTVSRRAYLDLFVRVLREGVNAGEFRQIDPQIAALSILGMCNWMSVWFRPDGRLDAAAIAEQMATLVLQGLDNRETRAPSGHLTVGGGH